MFKGRWKHQEVAVKRINSFFLIPYPQVAIKRIRKKPGASEEDLNKAIKQLFKEIWTLSCFRLVDFSF